MVLTVNDHVFIRANLITVFVRMLFFADVDDRFHALSAPISSRVFKIIIGSFPGRI